MKKPYSKPLITVESLQLDLPIALNCQADYDDMQSLLDLGYFNPDKVCTINEDEIQWGNDTICYHSNIQQAFLS